MRSLARTSLLAGSGVLLASSLLGAAAPRSAVTALAVVPVVPPAMAPAPEARLAPPLAPPLVALSIRNARPTYADLPPLRIVHVNGGATCTVRLYDASGAVDPEAVAAIEATLADVRDPREPHVAALDPRMLKLLFRAAYHFGAAEVEVVSAYRKPGRYREGLHAHGRAIDFRLVGPSAKELAEFLRAQPRAGVGQYIHPRTQYVHLDVRDDSYHWLDGTPPGRAGGAWRIPEFGLPALDASWTPEHDLPENVLPRDVGDG